MLRNRQAFVSQVTKLRWPHVTTWSTNGRRGTQHQNVLQRNKCRKASHGKSQLVHVPCCLYQLGFSLYCLRLWLFLLLFLQVTNFGWWGSTACKTTVQWVQQQQLNCWFEVCPKASRSGLVLMNVRKFRIPYGISTRLLSAWIGQRKETGNVIRENGKQSKRLFVRTAGGNDIQVGSLSFRQTFSFEGDKVIYFQWNCLQHFLSPPSIVLYSSFAAVTIEVESYRRIIELEGASKTI